MTTLLGRDTYPATLELGAYFLIWIWTVAEKFPDQKYSGPVALLHDKYEHRVTPL
jgi:hypothetical protein